MAAAAVVVAVVAAPTVWRRYQRPAVMAQMGTVMLESTPPGSTVIIDGVERGTTPFTTELAPGLHNVEFRYQRNVRAVELVVAAGEPTTSNVDWTQRTGDASTARR